MRARLARAAAHLATAMAIGLAAALPAPALATAPHPLCGLAQGETAPEGRAGRNICAVIATAGPGRPPRAMPAGEAATAALAAALHEADLILLGEVHDNPVHHAFRASLIVHLEGTRPARHAKPAGLVLEHIRADQGLALAGFQALDRQSRRSAGDLFKALDWERSGWPAAVHFAPLLEAALDLELPIKPGDPSRADIRAVARGGIGAARDGELQRLGLDAALPGPLQTALIAELEASHCGLMRGPMLGGLADAQRYRDAHLARALADAAEANGRAILLAGNGHVRADRGVPWHLARMAPGRRIAAVLHVEVDPARLHADGYIERGPDGAPLADYVVVTAVHERADPCIGMRERFKAHKK